MELIKMPISSMKIFKLGIYEIEQKIFKRQQCVASMCYVQLQCTMYVLNGMYYEYVNENCLFTQ